MVAKVRYDYCMQCGGNTNHKIVCDSCKEKVMEMFSILDSIKDRSLIQDQWYYRYKRLLDIQEGLDNAKRS